MPSQPSTTNDKHQAPNPIMEDRDMSFKKKAFLLVLLVLAFQYPHVAMAQEGTEAPEDVDSGFLFYDGKYIEAPYRVENRDLAVFINGLQITPYPWIRPSLSVTEDPGRPPGVTRETSLDDLYKIKWQGRMPCTSAKFLYLWGKYGEEKAQRRMITYYRSLSCIKKATRVYGDGVKLTDYKGNSLVAELSIPGRLLQPPPTEEELQKQVDATAAFYKELLQQGDCYFFFKKGAALIMTERKGVNAKPTSTPTAFRFSTVGSRKYVLKSRAVK